MKRAILTIIGMAAFVLALAASKDPMIIDALMYEPGHASR